MVRPRTPQTPLMKRVLTTLRGTGDRTASVRLLVAATLMAMPLACSGRYLDVGADARSGSGGVSGSPTAAGGSSPSGAGGVGSGARPACMAVTEPAWPDPVSCMPAPDSPMVGRYKGHWPVNAIIGGGDALLTLQGLTADGVPCGTLSIGDGAPLPPATDPKAPYPPGTESGFAGGPATGYPPGSYGEFPGHDYPIIQVESAGPRLAFSVPVNEPWRGWCGLQTPVPGEGVCLHVDGASSDGMSCADHAGHPLSCAQLFLCALNRVCVCDDSCCDADTHSGHTVDLHWDGRAFQGSVDSTYQIFLDPVP